MLYFPSMSVLSLLLIKKDAHKYTCAVNSYYLMCPCCLLLLISSPEVLHLGDGVAEHEGHNDADGEVVCVVAAGYGRGGDWSRKGCCVRVRVTAWVRVTALASAPVRIRRQLHMGSPAVISAFNRRAICWMHLPACKESPYDMMNEHHHSLHILHQVASIIESYLCGPKCPSSGRTPVGPTAVDC